jgi:hypothetical protein
VPLQTDKTEIKTGKIPHNKNTYFLRNIFNIVTYLRGIFCKKHTKSNPQNKYNVQVSQNQQKLSKKNILLKQNPFFGHIFQNYALFIASRNKSKLGCGRAASEKTL